MAKLSASVAWLLPLALFSEDALAWGLYTHVYFAQLLIWAIPLADPRFRRAAARLPGLLLAGVCLPDLALFGRHVGAPELKTTHQWSVARRLISEARDDEARVLALGYASHLLTDVVAHNHFVPAHEQMWLDRPVITHAASEWIMDAFVEAHLFARPSEVMRHHHAHLAGYVTERFRCDSGAACRALRLLEHGEATLRKSRLPHLLLGAARKLDCGVERRFNWYIAETTARLHQINRLIEGEAPVWHAEPERVPAGRGRSPAPNGLGSPLPQDFF